MVLIKNNQTFLLLKMDLFNVEVEVLIQHKWLKSTFSLVRHQTATIKDSYLSSFSFTSGSFFSTLSITSFTFLSSHSTTSGCFQQEKHRPAYRAISCVNASGWLKSTLNSRDIFDTISKFSLSKRVVQSEYLL